MYKIQVEEPLRWAVQELITLVDNTSPAFQVNWASVISSRTTQPSGFSACRRARGLKKRLYSCLKGVVKIRMCIIDNH